MKKYSGQSELSKQSKTANWHKLQVKGACAQLRSVGVQSRLDTYNTESLIHAVDKIEKLLLAQIDLDYAQLKGLILAERENNKAIDELQF